jgi:alpha-methylacyl-CoA racemase
MGPLSGIRVIEIGGLGPGPFAGMLLADMGATVLRVERPPRATGTPYGLSEIEGTDKDVIHRGRSAITLDLRQPEGLALLLRLAEGADVLFEGFRPGVAERLGFGPDVVLARNGRLVYGRVTGYGQAGPLARRAGHDINYISVAGVLRNIARGGQAPVPPANFIGDYGGGGMLLALGIVSALLEARISGKGQVVDAAMVDGSALLTARIHSLRAGGSWNDDPGTNLLDSGAHFYEVYETADGKFMSVGAIEPQFYAELLRILDVPVDEWPDQLDRERWPELKRRLADVFRSRTRDDWCAAFEGSDACCTPVLELGEVADHPYNAGRETFVAPGGVVQPAPAPRFSRTPSELAPRAFDRKADEILGAWDVDADTVAELEELGVLGVEPSQGPLPPE